MANTKEVVGYAGAHRRVRTRRGAPQEYQCYDCGNGAQEWAYDDADPDELRDEKGRPFSLEPHHYVPLCVPCHRLRDMRGTCKNGHPWTPETTYRGKIHRYCRKCRTEYMRAYRARPKEN